MQIFWLSRACRTALALLFLAAGMSSAVAAELPQPTGTEILIVDGAISATNQGETAVFDQEMLAAIDTYGFTTSNPWVEMISDYEGVRLSALMEALGADTNAETIVVVALDGYVAEVPISDFVEYSPILAWSRDGKRMTVRDKGPLWLVYPYDTNPDLAGEVFSTRSVWQIERITVE